MPERVIVIDPGERTGWAKATIEDDGTIRDVVLGVHTIRDFATALYEGQLTAKDAPHCDVIVYETWRLFPDKVQEFAGSEFLTVQLIGMIRLIAWRSGARLKSMEPRVKQSAAAHMPPELLKMRRRCSEEHSKDALDLLTMYWFRKWRKGAAS
jgi:hypothetical protein